MTDDQVAFQAQLARAREVKQAHESELMSKANVVGVGVGFRQMAGKPTPDVAIVVMVKVKVPSADLQPEDTLPVEIEGVPVDVQPVGEFDIHG